MSNYKQMQKSLERNRSLKTRGKGFGEPGSSKKRKSTGEELLQKSMKPRKVMKHRPSRRGYSLYV